MVSTLASQLQALREAGAGSKQRTDTFLYDPREAARVDNETIYNLAWNGLLELKQMDARFEEFDTNHEIAKLFSRQRINFHRAQTTKQEDADLNAALAKVLDALSGYFLLGATHKILEFLVRRYEIHRFNVDDVMATIVSYHESTWFAKMVRILHIHNTRWEFLLQVKRSGSPLLRAALVQRALDESSIVEFLFTSATRIGASNPKLISLYTLVTLQMLEQAKVREETLRWLIPQLLTSLKSATYPELQSSAYMIVTKLASKAILTEKVIDTLAKHLVKYAQPGTQMNALLCVIFLAQAQPSFHISKGVGKHLVAMESIVDLLGDAVQSYETTKFVRALVLFLVDSIAAVDDNSHNLLRSVITNVALADELVDELVTLLMAQAQKDRFDEESARVAVVSDVLVVLSKQHVGKVDAAVHTILGVQGKTQLSKKEVKLANKFVSKTFGNVANSAHFLPSTTDAKTSLALALEHPTENTRYQALVSLDKQNQAAPAEPVLTNGSVLLRRMADDSERVAKFVVTSSLGDLVLKTTSKKKSFETIVQVVHKWSRAPSSNARSVLDTVVTFALTKFRSVHSSDNDDNLFKLLLAFASTEISQKKEKKPLVRVETLAKWLATLDHPFSAALATAIKKTKEGEAPVLVDVFGATLADNVQRLLPFCLSWSQRSDVIVEPRAELLVRVLHAARNVLKQKKNAAKDQAAIDQSFRFILKKEFVAVCEQQAASPSAECKSMPWAIEVADLLRQVALDAFAACRDEFDACVAALLQAPTLIFLNVQGSLLQLFQESETMERELLPTMARLVTSSSVDVMALLVKSRALDIVSAVLEGSAYETDSADELTRVVHIVPSVLVALADATTSVRQSAIACLDRWLVSCSDAVLKSRSNDLHTLLDVTKYLMNAKQDILMDANAVAVLCGTFATASKKDSTAFYQLLINYIASASTKELPVAVKLLNLLAHVTETAFWLQSVDYFQQTLTGLVSASSSNNHVSTVLTILLSHFLDVNVAITTTGAKKQPSVPKPFVEALFAVLSCSSEALARVQTLQVHALSKLSPAFYDALDDVNRFVLVAKLLKLLVVADESVAGALIACLNALPVQYEVFVKLLEDELSVVKAADNKRKPVETRFQDLSCVLEVLAVKVDGTTASSNLNESAASANLLLKALCDVLALFCAKENESVVSEYILQVLFGCLRRVCEVSAASSANSEQPTAGKRNAKHRGAAVEVEPKLLVKHTLDCLSRTSSPQTRNEALLFVSALVDLFPASVLKSLEKILSFVGGGSIHQDDEYSFHVLETIVKSVVPHILDSQSKEKDGAASEGLITTQQFIRIFVDAYDQIPASRRELLFSVLVEALGRDSLTYCVVALLQKSAMIGTEPQVKDLTAFAHSLCFACDATLQISTLVSVLKIARDLFPYVVEDSDTDTDDVDDDEDASGDANGDAYEPFVVDEKVVKTKAKVRALNSALVAFVPAHLQARELHHKILSLQNKEQQMHDDNEDDENESEADQLQQSYLMLAQVVLLYFRRVAREQSLQQEHDVDDDSDNESASTSFWSSLATEIIEVLTTLQKLLSTPGFVAVIGELLHHENSMVRKKAMQLFNERLQEERASLTSGEELLFVDMLDELEVILQNADGNENTVNVQTALLSVDILARNFATTHAKRFQQSLPTVVKYVELDPSTASPTTLHLFGCAFVCISSICHAVGALVFPLLPKFFPKLLAGIMFCSSKLKPAKGEDKTVASGMVTVLQCLLASLEVFTEKIPQFLAPYLSKILQVLLSPSILASNGSASNMQVQLSIDCSLLNLSNNVELRHLLPNVFGAYEFALVQGDVSVEKLFSLVSTIVAALDVSSLRQYLPNFARFFVTALDARRVHASKMQDVDAVEDEILECLVQFVLKLSEKQLKPLFLKIAEWAQAKLPGSGANKNGDISRRISFFKLVVKLSERLRGIFVPYYAHVLDYLTATLVDTHSVLAQKKNRKAEADDEIASDDDDDDFFTRDDKPASKKTKMANGHATAVGDVTECVRESYALLLRTTVRALNGCFVHDSDGFMEKERFDVVMSPLVDVFDIVKHDASAKDFVYDVVTACVANLAWAAKSDLLWKPLHYAVLMKSRSDSPAVRLATLKTVEKCYQVIGDEFLAMLPESIPFLAELMEDTDAEVERTCHQVIKQIEEISGESLDQYLTS
ncbi:hypothetical protein FI667_g13898, partial [Globisporangium splendens]